MQSFDVIVIGAGVVGCAVAWQLVALGAKRVLVIDRGRIAEGTTAQSSGILRTHYSVPENVELARRSWQVFSNFSQAMDDDDASAGLVKCGYLIAAPQGPQLAPLQASLDAQAAMGIPVMVLSREDAQARLPICRFDDAALIGFEPEAGFADATMVATSFARAARRGGAQFLEGLEVLGLLRDAGPAQGHGFGHKAGRVVGVDTVRGPFMADTVVSTQNIWARDIERWTGVPTPVHAERHLVLALAGSQPYNHAMPVYKDLGSRGMLYCRSYGGQHMLVSEGTAGEVLALPSNDPGDVSWDQVASVGEQVAERFAPFAAAGVAASWTGVYDVTPDWNPVLGRLPDVPGLVVGYGFSGHGFKLSPAVGRVLAQEALGLATDVPLAPYALERFRGGRLLRGRYGVGAVS